MNEITKEDNIKIENMIYEIRGKQVMLDSDLAKLFGVETKRINEAVKNNPKKFPERFTWILTKEEAILFSRSKISTLNENKIKRGQNLKYLPKVFTEQGVAIKPCSGKFWLTLSFLFATLAFSFIFEQAPSLSPHHNKASLCARARTHTHTEGCVYVYTHL